MLICDATDIGAVLGLSFVLIGGFLYWQHLIEKHSSRPPIAKLSLFTRQKGKLTAILAVAFLTVTGVSVRRRFLQALLRADNHRVTSLLSLYGIRTCLATARSRHRCELCQLP